MSEDRFFDLAMKAIAKQTSPDEQAELDGLLTRQPELQQEYERLQADARLAKEVLPLLAAAQATEGKVPGYARERLRTKVRETYKNERRQESTFGARGVWRWWLSLAGAAAVVMAAVFFLRPTETVVQVAMLDSVGGIRGSASNLVAVIEQAWQKPKVVQYSEGADLKRWMAEWPEDRRSVVKIVYDRDAQEVRVSGRLKNRPGFEKTFVVNQEKDLPNVLKEVQQFIKEQTGR